MEFLTNVPPEIMRLIELIISGGFIYKGVDLLKQMGLPDKFAPLASFGLGLIAGLMLVTWAGGQSIYTGILAGLSMAGITSTAYKQVKSLQE